MGFLYLLDVFPFDAEDLVQVLDHVSIIIRTVGVSVLLDAANLYWCSRKRGSRSNQSLSSVSSVARKCLLFLEHLSYAFVFFLDGGQLLGEKSVVVLLCLVELFQSRVFSIQRLICAIELVRSLSFLVNVDF